MSLSLAYRTLTASVDRLRRLAQLDHVKTHTFYSGGLDTRSVIVDLGANVGEFAGEMTQKFDCRCLAVEALPDLCSVIPRTKSLEVFNVAISDVDGPVTLHLSDNRECNSMDLSIATEYGYRGPLTCDGMTLETFLRRQGLDEVDLLKVDIEGAEARMFASTSDATLKRLKQVSIEFHDFIPGSISGDEVQRIFARMARLGFYRIPFSYVHPRMKHCDVLFVQLSATKVGPAERLVFGLINLLLRAQDLKARLGLKLRPNKAPIAG